MTEEPADGVWYELCPVCEGERDGCTECWDQLTAHECTEEAETTVTPEPEFVPSCLLDAYGKIEAGHAFVACIPSDEGVEVIYSIATMRDVICAGGTPYMALDQRADVRMAFLLAGVRTLVRSVSAN